MIKRFGGTATGESEGLQRTREKHDSGGHVWFDSTGLSWWVLDAYGARQAGHACVAAALYNAIGLLAPSIRRIELDGKVRAIHLAPTGWGRLPPAEIRRKWSEEVDRTRIADRWLRNTATVADSMRFRERSIPTLPSMLRLKLTQTMGYRGIGHLDQGWETLELPEISEAEIPVARRIAKLSRRRIRGAVSCAGLDDRDAISLWGTLITRQEAIRRAIA